MGPVFGGDLTQWRAKATLGTVGDYLRMVLDPHLEGGYVWELEQARLPHTESSITGLIVFQLDQPNHYDQDVTSRSARSSLYNNLAMRLLFAVS